MSRAAVQARQAERRFARELAALEAFAAGEVAELALDSSIVRCEGCGVEQVSTAVVLDPYDPDQTSRARFWGCAVCGPDREVVGVYVRPLVEA